MCPWWLLEEGLLSSYRDREDNQEKPNWTHIYNDVAVLESRHAFDDNSIDIASALFDIYFPTQTDKLKPENWWNEYGTDKQLIKTGILGDRSLDGSLLEHRLPYTTDNTETGKLNQTKVNKAINDWTINLAKVGFHLCQQQKQ